MPRLSLTDKIVRELFKRPGMSSWQYAKRLKANSNVVSGILHSLEKRSLVSRKEGQGPRGGFGWYLVGKKDVSGPHATENN